MGKVYRPRLNEQEIRALLASIARECWQTRQLIRNERKWLEEGKSVVHPGFINSLEETYRKEKSIYDKLCRNLSQPTRLLKY